MAHAFSKLPVNNLEDETCKLSRTIPAIQSAAYPANAQQIGVIVRRPRGVKLTLIGKGFSSRTMKVRCQQVVYFVFLEDLDKETQETWTAGVPCGNSTL
jgi:hypothetical protein